MNTFEKNVNEVKEMKSVSYINNIFLITYVQILFNFSRLWFTEIVLLVWFNCMKFTAKETQMSGYFNHLGEIKYWLIWKLFPTAILYALKIMLLCKSQEDLEVGYVFSYFYYHLP